MDTPVPSPRKRKICRRYQIWHAFIDCVLYVAWWFSACLTMSIFFLNDSIFYPLFTSPSLVVVAHLILRIWKYLMSCNDSVFCHVFKRFCTLFIATAFERKTCKQNHGLHGLIPSAFSAWYPLDSSLAGNLCSRQVYGIKDWKEIKGPFNPAPLFCITQKSKEGGNQLCQNPTARWYQRGDQNPGPLEGNSCLKPTFSGGSELVEIFPLHQSVAGDLYGVNWEMKLGK